MVNIYTLSVFTIREIVHVGSYLFKNLFGAGKVKGLENVPKTGGALLVPNHVTFIDWIFLSTCLDREVRFLVDSSFYKHPLFGPFLKLAGAMPVTAKGNPQEIKKSLKEAGDNLERGELVCIFAEGQLTRTGSLQPFRKGAERIVKGREVPILPVYLDGLWGSIFSFESERFFFKRPKKLPYEVNIYFGAPLSSSTPVSEIRKAVQRLGVEAAFERKSALKPLHRAFVESCRGRLFKKFIFEAEGRPCSRLQALTGALALATPITSGTW